MALGNMSVVSPRGRVCGAVRKVVRSVDSSSQRGERRKRQARRAGSTEKASAECDARGDRGAAMPWDPALLESRLHMLRAPVQNRGR